MKKWERVFIVLIMCAGFSMALIQNGEKHKTSVESQYTSNQDLLKLIVGGVSWSSQFGGQILNSSSSNPERKIVVKNGGIVDYEFTAEIVDDYFSREKGLMFRTNMSNDRGMLFVWNDEQNRSFWMKNTLMPLDMIFIGRGMNVVDINKNMQPCVGEECTTYVSKPSQYVLEINGGLSDRLNISIGDKIEFL